ncbi:hypothetical protein ACFWPV_31195 [Streptomyces uncialis]|uniref:hypothetical protein n=1 Tax=Streptomyces TaxID=1883 RepID=UPI000823F4D3|nr:MULTISPECIES: hypothetical protein [unclassified Streptomyces]SCK62740.1 hypothetical protein YW7DRAFT_06796 [Streptomyces sp. AmelKG-E11A]
MEADEQNGQNTGIKTRPGQAGEEPGPPADGPSGTLAGCLVAILAGAVGLAVWLHGARPGIRGGFEGERDLSLVYGELPLMLFGVPALTLTVWSVSRAALRDRLAPFPRAAVLVAVVGATLALLGWLCLLWLESRVAFFAHPPW